MRVSPDMAAQETTKGKKKDKRYAPTGPPVTDPRFEAVQWDPRFHRFPKANRHVEIDKRFEGILCLSAALHTCKWVGTYATPSMWS